MRCKCFLVVSHYFPLFSTRVAVAQQPLTESHQHPCTTKRNRYLLTFIAGLRKSLAAQAKLATGGDDSEEAEQKSETDEPKEGELSQIEKTEKFMTQVRRVLIASTTHSAQIISDASIDYFTKTFPRRSPTSLRRLWIWFPCLLFLSSLLGSAPRSTWRARTLPTMRQRLSRCYCNHLHCVPKGCFPIGAVMCGRGGCILIIKARTYTIIYPVFCNISLLFGPPSLTPPDTSCLASIFRKCFVLFAHVYGCDAILVVVMLCPSFPIHSSDTLFFFASTDRRISTRSSLSRRPPE